jgi:hypothetical protein
MFVVSFASTPSYIIAILDKSSTPHEVHTAGVKFTAG